MMLLVVANRKNGCSSQWQEEKSDGHQWVFFLYFLFFFSSFLFLCYGCSFFFHSISLSLSLFLSLSLSLSLSPLCLFPFFIYVSFVSSPISISLSFPSFLKKSPLFFLWFSLYIYRMQGERPPYPIQAQGIMVGHGSSVSSIMVVGYGGRA